MYLLLSCSLVFLTFCKKSDDDDDTPAADGTGTGTGSGTGTGTGSGTDTNNDTTTTDKPGSFTITSPAGSTHLTEPTVVWSEATGAVTYKLIVASDASCSSVIQTHADLAAATKVLATLTEGTYYICVTAINVHGETNATNTGFMFKVDVTQPPALANFYLTNTGALGTVDVHIQTPSDVTDYSVLEIAVSLTSIPTTCETDVKLDISAYILANFSVGIPISTTAGALLYIRACVQDAAGNLTVSAQATATTSTTHRIFVTSETFNGALNADYNNVNSGVAFDSGPLGADARCQYLAENNGILLSDATWKAIVSTDTENAKDRLSIVGKVVDLNDDEVASSSSVFWNSGFAKVVSTDEALDELASNQTVWTGTDNDGTKLADNCTNWTSNAGGVSGRAGQVVLSTSWLNNSAGACSATKHLFCIEQESEERSPVYRVRRVR